MPLGLDGNFYKKVLPLLVIETGLFAYAFTSDLRSCQVILGLVGLWWCFAALWVEVSIEHTYPHFQWDNPVDPEMKAYRPFCDFAPWAKCSKVLMSPPGRFVRYFGISKDHHEPAESTLDKVRQLIDLPNPTLGVAFFSCQLFYPCLLLIPYLAPYLPWLFFAACVFVAIMTAWLASNLIFVLKDFCVVCVSMYVANFAIVPMMYNIAKQNLTSYDDYSGNFFGEVPKSLWHPFLALDIFMGVAVLTLYMKGPSQSQQLKAGYEKLIGHV
mmetsp:Transcript_29200/g.44117  ORF Transcript_29200/g.44117 Transcript_29200/m.44117 type:complete len:270 (+) Transcript_29200:113-922(+)|eukprot:CAMPEP_0194747004 /NCGR_PEP_ID=MMETSP0323_2-20130528/1075_1 /TAXON_ID=2866 ORGANISM="Crypthecodinium cohnii, Strain Seligo" /NCGR_SAMPLE_ID=MMETSP0323_2 /ASSEMBLY_ACC=CAM_ASM_000346 /LENGTH=269 /DNA_ID=CAMNT_0039659975 /DNA_START=151 /DNA_END=960 /DNA_ORIENTATION=-